MQEIEAGELKHHILQALCRSSVRQGKGSDCGQCNTYIIAPKRSGIRVLLPEIFPGCTVSTWKPAKVKLTGWVADAVKQVEAFFAQNPQGVYLYKDLREGLGIADISNFNKRVRRHGTFKAALHEMGVEEVITGTDHRHNALAMTWKGISLVEGSSYIADV